jgi:hypothetical protein
MNKKQRKSYTTAFKVKIALEAIKGQRTSPPWVGPKGRRL